MSLTQPHHIWWPAGSNLYEVTKAVIQCRMLSGRYRTRLLTSKWSDSKDSSCLSCGAHVETLQHILLECRAYSEMRSKVVKKWQSVQDGVVAQLALDALCMPPGHLMQFILDATVLPLVRLAVSFFGKDLLCPLLSLTRTWCYSLHRERLRILGDLKYG